MITDGSLVARIKKIHPSLTEADFYPDGTVKLQDDTNGKGMYIKSWTHGSLSQPTEDEIKAVTL